MSTEITGLKRRLSPQDSIFYYLETDQAPMTIGSIAVFEGHVPYRRFAENIESKMHQIPRYMQKAVETPFNFARPTWEFDRDFDLHRHIKRVTLAAPGTDQQLTELAERLFRGRLDRSKPLWDMHFVEGLEGGRTGLISRVHHCLVDGVGGVDLLMVTLDPTPETRAPTRVLHEPAQPQASGTSRVVDAVADLASEAVDVGASIARWMTDVLTGNFTSTRTGMRALNVTLNSLQDPAKELPFNRDFSGGRKIAHVEIPFAEVREIRRALGGTVNDVVLAVLGGALSRYTEHHGHPTEGVTARVMTPVNVRNETERGMLGNRVSMLVVEVPLGANSPVERLRTVNERTKALKEDRVADGVAAIGQTLASLQVPVLTAMANTVAMGNGMGNIVCTNVPGPMIPLYTVGHRMLAHYPIMPIAWNMGIGCAVMSYDQHLFVTFVADAAAAPDVAVFAEFMQDAYTELRTEAGVPSAEEILAHVPDRHATILGV